MLNLPNPDGHRRSGRFEKLASEAPHERSFEYSYPNPESYDFLFQQKPESDPSFRIDCTQNKTPPTLPKRDQAPQNKKSLL